MKKFSLFLLAICMCLNVFTPVSAAPIFNRYGKVLVLTYHKISENPADWGDYCVSPSIFESDIKYLKSSGYEFLTASQLKNTTAKDKKIAVITFDDGYESDLKYAVPVLEKYGAVGTFFIFGDALNTEGYLTKAQLTEMSKKPCVEIGNHSDKLHRKNYAAIMTMFCNPEYEDEVIKDFENNAEILKELTGKSPAVLSYPNGIYSQKTDSRLKTLGYSITFSTEEIPFRAISEYSPVGRKNRGCQRKIQDIEKYR